MKIKRKDFSNIRRLLRQLWPHKNFNVKIEINDIKNDKVFYIRKKRNIIGFLSMTYNNLKIARVKRIVIDKNIRGKGLGTKLLNKATIFAKKAGCKVIWLNTGLNRTATRKFYLKNGFYQIVIFTAIFIKWL